MHVRFEFHQYGLTCPFDDFERVRLIIARWLARVTKLKLFTRLWADHNDVCLSLQRQNKRQLMSFCAFMKDLVCTLTYKRAFKCINFKFVPITEGVLLSALYFWAQIGGR
jgi:hypothetical protein